jgi:hypothetical protein
MFRSLEKYIAIDHKQGDFLELVNTRSRRRGSRVKKTTESGEEYFVSEDDVDENEDPDPIAAVVDVDGEPDLIDESLSLALDDTVDQGIADFD